jgi:hypothetical protein
MNWYDYIDDAYFDYDWSDDTFDIAKQAYVAGLESALAVLLRSEDGDHDFHIFELIQLIKESE